MRMIDADALKQTICLDQCGHMKETCDAECELIAYITNAPTIEAEPVKHGKWFDAMVGELPVQVCDQCSTFFPLAYTGGGHHYCPNCGAKMDGGNA